MSERKRTPTPGSSKPQIRKCNHRNKRQDKTYLLCQLIGDYYMRQEDLKGEKENKNQDVRC